MRYTTATQLLTLYVDGTDGRPVNLTEVAIHASTIWLGGVSITEGMEVWAGQVHPCAKVEALGAYSEGEAQAIARSFAMRFRIPTVRWVLTECDSDTYLQPGAELPI